MTDIGHCGIQLGVLRRLVNTIFVKNQLTEIFNYSAQVLERKKMTFYNSLKPHCILNLYSQPFIGSNDKSDKNPNRINRHLQ